MQSKFKEINIDFSRKTEGGSFQERDKGSVITGVARRVSNGIWRAYITDDGTINGNQLITGDARIGVNAEVVCSAEYTTDSPRDVPIANPVSEIVTGKTLDFAVIESKTSSIGIFGGVAEGMEFSNNPAILVHFIIIVYGENIG